MKLDIEFNEDEPFLSELTKYVETLTKPTDEQLKKYDRMMMFMESIHDEIRDRYPDFMPEYDVSIESEFPVGNKYLEMMYEIVRPEKKEFDSH